jgi:hypothetical protein
MSRHDGRTILNLTIAAPRQASPEGDDLCPPVQHPSVVTMGKFTVRGVRPRFEKLLCLSGDPKKISLTDSLLPLKLTRVVIRQKFLMTTLYSTATIGAAASPAAAGLDPRAQ